MVKGDVIRRYRNEAAPTEFDKTLVCYVENTEVVSHN